MFTPHCLQITICLNLPKHLQSSNAVLPSTCNADMLLVNTKALVRLLVHDDAKQAEAADPFIAKGAWVSHLVLAETLWVLQAVYNRTTA